MGSQQLPHNPKKHKVIAIDGPAGAGKSTVAKALAKRLGYFYLDTGAMYRSLTLKAMRENLDFTDEKSLVALARRTKIDLKDHPDGTRVFLDGEDVSQEIRTQEVTNNTSIVAKTPGVRKIMVQWQRDIAGKKDVVMEGRDVTTVVFPAAEFKFYLDADLNERTKRRLKDLDHAGKKVDPSKLTAEIHTRDESDMKRGVGALKKADDAVVIDSTHHTVDQTVSEILQYIQAKHNFI